MHAVYFRFKPFMLSQLSMLLKYEVWKVNSRSPGDMISLLFCFPMLIKNIKFYIGLYFTNHWPYKNNHQLKLGSKKYTGARPNHVSPWPNCYLINSYPVNCYSLNCCLETIEKGKLLICFVCFGMSSQLQLTCWTS